MPTPSALPLRTQVIDRVATVLGNITAGATYWFTPCQVVKRYIPWEELQGDVTYMVFAGTGDGSMHIDGAGGGLQTLYKEDVFITIKGAVRSDVDTATMVGKCITDVRNAINVDACSGTSGSLMTLTDTIDFDKAPITDNGWLANMNYGEFEIQLHATTVGTLSQL